jgi:cyclase
LHTSDSISVYDEKDEVLIVGDNVEEPEPYMNDVSKEVFIKTLESYLKYPFRYIIAGHYWSENDIVLRENIKKLKMNY